MTQVRHRLSRQESRLRDEISEAKREEQQSLAGGFVGLLIMIGGCAVISMTTNRDFAFLLEGLGAFLVVASLLAKFHYSEKKKQLTRQLRDIEDDMDLGSSEDQIG